MTKGMLILISFFKRDALHAILLCEDITHRSNFVITTVSVKNIIFVGAVQ